MSQQRATAYKAIIDDVVSADYISQEPPHPNYLNLYGARVRRLQLVGLLVQKSSHHFVVDDGTNRVTAKRFNQDIDMDHLDTGDAVLVIGRPRNHNDTIFLGAEIVHGLADEAWIQFHKDTVNALYDTEEELEDDHVAADNKADDVVNYSETLIDVINDIDDGDGAPTNKVIEASSLDEAEQHINTLINEGEIFEIRPGRLKVL